MTRRWPWALPALLMIALAAGGCLRSVEIEPADVTAESEIIGNVLAIDKKGVHYHAQSFFVTPTGDSLRLIMVEIVDDGVVSRTPGLTVAKQNIESFHYYQNDNRIVLGLVGAISLFMVFLYYKINTSLFD